MNKLITKLEKVLFKNNNKHGASRLLYKYRSLNSGNINNTLKVISKKELYFSDPSDFNDPFEFYCPIDRKTITEDLLKDIITELAKDNNLSSMSNDEVISLALVTLHKYHELKKADFISHYGVCSFTESADNLLLWSHYEVL